jgi:hypothetical protein
MKKKTVLFLSFILSFSAVAFAQTKTVTNADLEKFRQKRLQNEKNYRENYERLGFPSPEQLERKRVEDEENLIEFSQQLETQRLQREAIRAEIENQSLLLQNQYQPSPEYSNYDSGAYIYGGYLPFNYGYDNYGRYNNRRSKSYGNRYNRNISPYPWIMIPGFNNQNNRPQRPLMNNPNSPIRIRPGRGRN